ncbi:MAG: PASTA domain-containing protein, partial [Microbacteriaceae bacterium]|nr:PASTA domain-containing protein [Microbacteriaceae bacterium]
IAVPALVGLEQAKAEQAIKDAGFRIGEAKPARFSEKTAGTVLAALDSSDKPLGKEYSERGAIKLILSAGPLPNVAEMPVDKAIATLEASRLKVDHTKKVEENHDKVPKGHVIRIVTGEAVHVGDAVSLVVSKGPALIAVPNVVGMNMNQAIAKLAEVGLKGRTGVPQLLRNAVKVKNTTPAPGSEVPKDTEIELGFEL